MAPRETVPVERARKNRTRAAEYQHDPGTPSSPTALPPVQSQDGSRYLPGRASDNRARASSYAHTSDSSKVPVRVGADGILIVPCSANDNIAGRIGEAQNPGDVFLIVRNNKTYRARCE